MFAGIKKYRKLIFIIFSILIFMYAIIVHHYRFVEYSNPTFFPHELSKHSYSEHIKIDGEIIDEIYLKVISKSSNIKLQNQYEKFLISHSKITDEHFLKYVQAMPILVVNIYDNDNIIDAVRYNYLTMNNYINDDKIRINTKIYNNVKWHNIAIEISCINCNTNNDILINYADNSNYTFKMLDTVKAEKNEYGVLFLSIFLMITSVAICVKNKINISFRKVVIIEFLLSLLFSFSLLKSFTLLYYYDNYNYIYILTFMITGIVLLSLIMNNFQIKNLSKLFVVLAIPLSMLYMIFVPVGEVPDENRHFYRSYGISNGDIVTPSIGNKIPIGMGNTLHKIRDYANYFDVIDKQYNYSGYEYIRDGADNYNAILYVFSSIGIKIGKLFHLNPYYCFYLGRILNLIFFLITGYLIIKLTPIGKLLTLIYLLNPMMLHQGMSISADVLLNQCSLLYIVYILNIRFIKQKIQIKDILLITLLLTIIFISKYVYAILILMLFLLKKEIKETPKELRKKLVLFLGIAIIFSLIYYFNFFGLSSTIVKTSSGVVNQNIALEHLKSNPINSIIVLVNTFQHYGSYYIESFAGGYLGWLKIAMGRLYVYLYILILFLTIYDKNDKYKLNNIERNILIFTSILITMVLVLGFYISISQSDLSIVVGVQGRYFIPYLILPLIALIGDKKKNLNKNLMINLIVIINLIAIDTIRLYYL